MKTALLVTLLAMMGCAEKKHVIVPRNCLGPMKVTDFTKPCTPTGSSSAICDGVKISFACVSYPKEKP